MKDTDSRWEGRTLCKGWWWTGELIVMIVTEGRIQPATKRRINNNEPKRVCDKACGAVSIKLKTVSGAAERDRGM